MTGDGSSVREIQLASIAEVRDLLAAAVKALDEYDLDHLQHLSVEAKK
jgi:hypothetical protein